jgi:hypothetical protein
MTICQRLLRKNAWRKKTLSSEMKTKFGTKRRNEERQDLELEDHIGSLTQTGKPRKLKQETSCLNPS